MTATATETEQAEVDQLDQIERDAQARIAELEPQEAALALDALSDPELAEELRLIQSERASAEAALRQAKMAREERARRAAEAERERERVAAERATREARRLQREREAAAKAIDTATDALGAAMAAFAAICLEQEVHLERAGLPRLKPPGSAVEASIVRSLFKHKIPPGMLQFGGISARPMAMVDSDPKSIDPKDGAE